MRNIPIFITLCFLWRLWWFVFKCFDCNFSLAVNKSISDELDAISNAVSAYANDSSSSNCDALKDACRDYIDALKDLQDCADQAGVGADFLLALSTAENIIDGLLF